VIFGFYLNIHSLQKGCSKMPFLKGHSEENFRKEEIVSA
jgi:hypothetical protein